MKQSIKVVVAPDSFKGSISARDAAAAIEKGLYMAAEGIDLTVVTSPIADGGEGTLAALADEKDCHALTVTGPDVNPVEAAFGVKNETAVIEMAAAAGLTLIPEEKRSAATATTYGVGELICAALDLGYRHILLTVGGSATNDGGCGMIAALGARFLDENGNAFVPTGGSLDRIAAICTDGLDPRLSETLFTVATDVCNPLFGEDGATYIYGRQKGADEASLAHMEKGMRHYAELLCTLAERDVASLAGCGAGGGLPAPLLAFCKAEITSGIRAVLETVGFNRHLADADLVITGEGRLDAQSLYGKAISGVTEAAGARGIPVVCLVGCVAGDRAALLRMGIEAIFATADIAPDAAYSMAHADELLTTLSERVFADFLTRKLAQKH